MSSTTRAPQVLVKTCTSLNAAVQETAARRSTTTTAGSKLKHEFLAIILGVCRPTVTVVLKDLQRAGLITSRYGRIRILKRTKLEAASCECHEVIRTHFARLGLGAVEVPSMPVTGERRPDSAGMRLRELTEYVYRLITTEQPEEPE